MAKIDDANIEARISKDISSFYSNLGSIEAVKSGRSVKVMEMAKMYASDAKSYLAKKELYTAFSCISYAHGLVDAVRELSG